jgi:hypothetical protein
VRDGIVAILIKTSRGWNTRTVKVNIQQITKDPVKIDQVLNNFIAKVVIKVVEVRAILMFRNLLYYEQELFDAYHVQQTKKKKLDNQSKILIRQRENCEQM